MRNASCGMFSAGAEWQGRHTRMEAEWLALTIHRKDRDNYLAAMRQASDGDLHGLVDFLISTSRKAIRTIMHYFPRQSIDGRVYRLHPEAHNLLRVYNRVMLSNSLVDPVFGGAMAAPAGTGSVVPQTFVCGTRGSPHRTAPGRSAAAVTKPVPKSPSRYMPLNTFLILSAIVNQVQNSAHTGVRGEGWLHQGLDPRTKPRSADRHPAGRGCERIFDNTCSGSVVCADRPRFAAPVRAAAPG